MIHTFNIKVKTPDEITEQMVVNKFCKRHNYNPDFDGTKVQFFKKIVSKFIIDAYRECLTEEKNAVVQTEIDSELQGIEAQE